MCFQSAYEGDGRHLFDWLVQVPNLPGIFELPTSRPCVVLLFSRIKEMFTKLLKHNIMHTICFNILEY